MIQLYSGACCPFGHSHEVSGAQATEHASGVLHYQAVVGCAHSTQLYVTVQYIVVQITALTIQHSTVQYRTLEHGTEQSNLSNFGDSPLYLNLKCIETMRFTSAENARGIEIHFCFYMIV